MKKIVFYILLITNATVVFTQEKLSYRDQMIRSEEAPADEIPESQEMLNQFTEFKKAKAWNSRASKNSIFSNPADLDISNIGGRVRASLVDTDNGIALVAPSGGGLWRFDPVQGTPFVPLNDFGSFLAITDIAQNPQNKNEIIIATGDEKHGTIGNGLFRSTDGGKTFLPMENTSPDVHSDFNYIRFVKFSPVDSSIMYLAAGKKLFKSTDSGANWTEVFENRGRIHSIDFLKNGGVIIAVDWEGVYTSITGDIDSFSFVNDIPNDITGFDKKFRGIVVASCPGNRDVLYTVLTKVLEDASYVMEVYKSTTGGTSWTKIATPPFRRVGQGTFSLTVGVHSTNPNILIIGNIAWSYSIDGGTTWEIAGGLEVDYHHVHFPESNPDLAYIGYDQGLGRIDFSKNQTFRVWNGTEHVDKVQIEQKEIGKTQGFNTTQLYYGDYFPESFGDAYIEGQQDGGSFASVNGKIRRIMVGDGGAAFINKQNPNKAFASTQNGNIARTENATDPTNFQTGRYTRIDGLSGDHTNFITQFAGNNADGEQLYISKKQSIERTTDGGNTFTSIASHELERVKLTVENAIDPIVYAIGYDRNGAPRNNTIIRVDKATTATTVVTYNQISETGSDGIAESIHIDPNNRNTVFITTRTGSAYKISNLDNNPIKTSIKGDIPNVNFRTVIGIKGEPNVLIAGTDVGLFYSTDQGTTWSISNEIPYTKIMDLKFRESDNRLFVFTHGRGAWATTVTISPLSVSEFETSSNWNSYPNPTNAMLYLKSQNNSILDLVKIYDEMGREVLKTTDNNIDVSNLASGIYILHLISEAKLSYVQKVIIE